MSLHQDDKLDSNSRTFVPTPSFMIGRICYSYDVNLNIAFRPMMPIQSAILKGENGKIFVIDESEGD